MASEDTHEARIHFRPSRKQLPRAACLKKGILRIKLYTSVCACMQAPSVRVYV